MLLPMCYPGDDRIPTYVGDTRETFQRHVGIHREAQLQGKPGKYVVLGIMADGEGGRYSLTISRL